MVGVVDVQLYTEGRSELEAAERSEDLFQLIGVHLAEAQQAHPLSAFRGRFPWLLCNIAGGILAALISGIFEEELKRTVALALFVPVVLGLAESVSIQSVSLTLQLIHAQTPTLALLVSKLRRELLTGLLLGLASAGCVALAAMLWLGDTRLAWCLLAGITGGVTASAMVGMAMPNVLRLLRRNPQVAAGPIALACADMITLVAYFSLARWLT
jgi:magnesium transporter